MKNKRTLLLSTALVCMLGASAYETPTMGWSSWNTYRVDISDELIKKQADAMASKGLKDVGYKYINIDDGYFGGRDANGKLLIHPTRFPDGLKPVVDHIHNLGFKAGIYSDAGKNTCGSFWDNDKVGVGVGMYQHDQQDADFFFKEMGFDFIKVDFCGGDPNQNADHLDLNEKERYTAIYNAIQNTGRDDVRINVCRWAFPGAWVHDVSTSWRISADINATWGAVKRIVDVNLYLSAYATEGKFNDMDMMEVGRGLSEEEDKTHFGMWCIMSSPLLIGCDMTTISDQALALIKNEELIALNQDPLALQAYVVEKQNGAYILVKDVEEMYGKKRAFAVYNPTDNAVEVTVDMKKLSLGGNIKVRDLFEKADKEDITNGKMTISIPAHGTRIYKLEAEERLEQSVYEAENAWLEKYSAVDAGDFARVQKGDNLSGGGKVSYLGGTAIADNYMEWRNVYSKEGGYYTMSIAYFSGQNRSITCTVNGTDTLQIDNLNSGDWNVQGIKTVIVKLNPGENVIRFSNAQGWAPDVDYIEFNKGNEAVEPVLSYDPTNLVTTPEDGKTYMIYAAATDAMTGGQGDRFGFLYTSATSLIRDTRGTSMNEVTLEESKKPLFTLEGSMEEGFKIKTQDGTYVKGVQVGSEADALTWTLEDGHTYNEKFPEQSWVIHSGSTYWNGNRNSAGDANSFATWTDGHPFQFYEYEVVETTPATVNEIYGKVKDALNGGNGVGYPNAAAKATFEEAIASAYATTDDVQPLTDALNAYISNTEDIVMPENGKTYILKNAKGGYLSNEGNALSASQTILTNSYNTLWNCKVENNKYQFQNVATNNWLGMASVQSTAENFETSPTERVNFGFLPLKKADSNQFIFSNADGSSLTTNNSKLDDETGSTDWGWMEVSKVSASTQHTAAGVGYATMIPSDIEAFTATVDKANGQVVLTPYTEKTVAAGIPLIYTAATDVEAYMIPATGTAAKAEQDIKWTAVAIDKPANVNAFIFKVVNNVAGFYPLAAGEQIPAGAVYFTTEGTDTNSVYTFYDKEATGINSVETDKNQKEVIYDLSGRKVIKTQNGIYIINGKKQVVK